MNKWTDFWAHSDFSLRIGRTTSHGPSCFPPRAGAVFLPLLLRVKLRFVLPHFFDESSERFVRLRIRHPRDQPVVMLNLLVEFDTLFTHGAFPHLREEHPVSMTVERRNLFNRHEISYLRNMSGPLTLEQRPYVGAPRPANPDDER